MAGAALGVGALVQPAARYFFRGDSKRQITVNFPRHPHYNIILSLLPEFTEKTGISVRVDILNYMRMYEKQMLELSKPVGDYDVICHLISWKTEYAQKRLVTPIDMFCTNKQFEEEDIIPAYKQGISTVGDRHYGFPSGAETSLLGYRADILKKHGMTPPKTYDELIDHIDYFKKAINNDPTEMDYKVHLAVALYRMYKYDDALTYYEEVKKAKPELVTQLDFIESMGESTPKFDKFD